jgi:neuropeptide Y receptor type 1
MLLYTLGTINRYNGLFREYREVMPYAIPIINGMAFLSHSLTVWLVVAITVDRYIAVCHPLRAVEICTRGRAKRVVAILVITLTLFSVPRFLEKTTGYIYDAELDGENAILTVIYREFHQHPVYIYLYETALYGGCQFLFPLLLLISLNIRLLWGLHQARLYRIKLQSSSQKHQKDDNISVMIAVVISVFLVCQFPNFLSYALRLLEIFDSSHAIVVNPQGSSLLNPITETLLRINSSVNFLIYMLVGKSFRKALFRVFGCSKHSHT